jgi:hypothetical protein
VGRLPLKYVLSDLYVDVALVDMREPRFSARPSMPFRYQLPSDSPTPQQHKQRKQDVDWFRPEIKRLANKLPALRKRKAPNPGLF